MCPVKEKCGRTFGVLLSGGTIFAGDWLITMAKVAGQLTPDPNPGPDPDPDPDSNLHPHHTTRTLTRILTSTLTFTLILPLTLTKVAGQMLEMVWRREQLETLIKVAQVRPRT